MNISLIKSKNILLRTDLDVPVEQGRVANDYRLRCLLPTLNLLLQHAASILIIGHKGRPEGKNEADSLLPIREWLEKAVNQSIFFIDSGFSPGEWVRGQNRLAMFDNLRFDSRELGIDLQFAKELSAGSDLYVYEAFASYNDSTSLRKIPEVLPTITGLQFDREVENLKKVLETEAKPRLLLLSGAKDDKLRFIESLDGKFEDILVGGRLASSAPSVCTPKGTCITSASLTADGLDISSFSTEEFLKKIAIAKTIILNGPLGKFEDGTNGEATRKIFTAIKESQSYSLVGGGDTLAAIEKLGFKYEDFDFVSTGGGAMLEFLETGTHPLLEILETNSVKK